LPGRFLEEFPNPAVCEEKNGWMIILVDSEWWILIIRWWIIVNGNGVMKSATDVLLP
jgi:hypothetical protein